MGIIYNIHLLHQHCSTILSISVTDSLHSSAESGVDSDAADLTHSDSSQSFTSTIDLLDHHIKDGGLGQVEYTLQYHRYAVITTFCRVNTKLTLVSRYQPGRHKIVNVQQFFSKTTFWML